MSNSLPPLLYKDDALLAFDKPSGLLSVPVRDYPELGNLVDMVQSRYGSGCMNVHRLDRDTSGIVVFGRTPEACRGMQHVLENRLAEKLYVALAHGSPATDAGTIDVPLAPDAGRAGRMVASAEGGKRCCTSYELIRQWSGIGRTDHVSMLRLWPRTGRTHQLRVHLSHMGCPILSDPFYGLAATGATDDADAAIIGRLALHAGQMSFPHPISGRPVNIVAPLPPDMQQAIELLDAAVKRVA